MNVFALNEEYPVGARSIALANASVTLTDIWSAFNNQAGLAWISRMSAGFHYENKFLVKQYALQAGAIALPLTPGTGSVSYRYFGYSKYNESKIGLAFARKLYRKFSAGVQLNYHTTYLAEGFGSAHALTAEVGLMYAPTDNFSLGVHVFNPNRVEGNEDLNDPISSAYRAGVCYHILNKATILFEAAKVLERKLLFKGGLEVNVMDNFDLRLGIGNDYMEYSFGVGYRTHRLGIDLAFSHHEVLGYSPSASFTFNLGKKR
ncbi:MAG TPA: hypothetical protein VHO90_13045 [Bacteroidales bacterium]|nr:hypothetical protein [Bacteroidales bacterium]